MWWMIGCAPEPAIRLHGVVWDGSGAAAFPLPQASLEVRAEDERLLGRTRSDADGAFSITLHETGTVFVIVRKDGYVPTTFPGVVGLTEDQPVEDHALYGVRSTSLAAEEARFAGCPGVGEGGSVGGEVRVFGLEDPVTGEAPLVTSGKARLLPADGGDDLPACYLDAAGEAVDPDAFWTGDAGAFGLFGVPPGVYALELRFEMSEDLYDVSTYPVLVLDEPGSRSPWYPAWVEFPN